MSGPRTPSADWRHRLKAAVTPLDSGVRGLAVNGWRPAHQADYRPNRTAAVLVPLLDEDEPRVVLTRRSDNLPTHAGQISFPGGQAEKQDRTAVHTALREAREEIGLPAEQTRAIGLLDRLDTISDYPVLPVVAVVTTPIEWRLDTREVAEVFTVPLEHVLDRGRYENRPIVRNQVEYPVWYLPYRQYTIWGATASMLLNLAIRYEGEK